MEHIFLAIELVVGLALIIASIVLLVKGSKMKAAGKKTTTKPWRPSARSSC